jgi:nicotinate-nucleotide adenylyltransferase
MKIGILGGTFDPPHAGHLALAHAALDQLGLDEIIFLPANRNPLKANKAFASGKHRVGMVEALIRQDSRLAVSDMEITRGGTSYSVDTLGELHMVRPAEYWFLMGADALKGLGDWKNPQRLMRLCRLGVAIRPPMSEGDVIARIPEEYKDKVDLIRMSPMDVSSTDLRDRLKRSRSVAPLIPNDVLKYIHTHQLYKD